MIFGLLAYRSEDLCVFELEFSSRAVLVGNANN